MSLAYIPPGVTVSEVVTPSFSAILDQPTSIAIVGPGLGYVPESSLQEQTTLVDNQWYTLAQDGVDINTLTVTGTDGTTYVMSGSSAKDFVFDQVGNRVRRDMPTNIADGETVAVYYTKSSGATSFTNQITLSRNNKSALLTQDVAMDFTNSTSNSIVVQKLGIIPPGDFTISGAGTGAVTIQTVASPTVLQSKQTVYVDYVISGTQFLNAAIVLNGTSTVSLPANSTAHVVKNAPTELTGLTASLYTKGAQGSGTTQTGDYVVSGTPATSDVSINRSNGTTTMGVANDQLQVTISYQATPSDYYLPTRVFSLADCTARFGEALNSDGTIASPVSFAAMLAFANGATNMVIQALYHLATPGLQSSAKSPGGTVSASATLQDWEDTLVALLDIEDVNVIVPVISAGGGTENDANNLAILQAVQAHIRAMQANQQYIVAICGQDSTVAGCVADAPTLRGAATTLAAGIPAEAMTHLSPASFAFPNPATGTTTNIGGQYVAAALAGMLAGNDISQTLTRKQLASVSGVNEFRSEVDKNTDASNGLLVVEAKNGIVRVRQALTVAISQANTRELSVIRAKYYMVESVRNSIDQQIIGQIVADDRAPITIQLVVQDALEALVTQGAIVTYSDIQVRQLLTDPTMFQVQFSYLPAFPLNYVQVVFSIDTSNGAITTSTTTTSS